MGGKYGSRYMHLQEVGINWHSMHPYLSRNAKYELRIRRKDYWSISQCQVYYNIFTFVETYEGCNLLHQLVYLTSIHQKQEGCLVGQKNIGENKVKKEQAKN